MSIHVRSKVERTYEIWLKERFLSSHVDAYVRDLSGRGCSSYYG